MTTMPRSGAEEITVDESQFTPKDENFTIKILLSLIKSYHLHPNKNLKESYY